MTEQTPTPYAASLDQLHARNLVINKQDDQIAATFRSATTSILGMVLDHPPLDTILDDWTYARRLRLVRNELHARALGEYRRDHSARDHVRAAYARASDLHLSRLAVVRTGYHRACALDELHTRAVTCFNKENDLYGTVGGVPGVQYGTRRRRLHLPS